MNKIKLIFDNVSFGGNLSIIAKSIVHFNFSHCEMKISQILSDHLAESLPIEVFPRNCKSYNLKYFIPSIQSFVGQFSLTLIDIIQQEVSLLPP